MTVNLSLSPLGSTGAKSLKYLTPDNNNTDIPIYVYATVTGTGTVTSGGTGTSTTPPITQGDFDGLQYLYYNVLNANSGTGLLSGGVDATNGPTLNATLGFNSNGSHAGTVQNLANSVSVGANPSAVAMSAYAYPRSASAVFNNFAAQSGNTYTYRADGTNIVVNGNSVSFLVETINYKPTSFTSANQSGGKLSTTFSVQVPTLGTAYTPSNYFLDTPSTTVTAGSLAATTQTAYTAGTGVTLTDTIAGDLDGNGTVNAIDFNTLLNNFNKNITGYANGDIDGNGVVNAIDFNALLNNFNFTVGVAPAGAVAPMASFAASIGDTAGFNAALAGNASYQAALASVPEPASMSMLAAIGAAAMVRRRRSR